MRNLKNLSELFESLIPKGWSAEIVEALKPTSPSKFFQINFYSEVEYDLLNSPKAEEQVVNSIVDAWEQCGLVKGLVHSLQHSLDVERAKVEKLSEEINRLRKFEHHYIVQMHLNHGHVKE